MLLRDDGEQKNVRLSELRAKERNGGLGIEEKAEMADLEAAARGRAGGTLVTGDR